MECESSQLSELKKLIHEIVDKLDEDVREVSYHHLQSMLRKKFDVKCSLRDIRGIFCDGRYIPSIGWGRGEDYLHRIPPYFKRGENLV